MNEPVGGAARLVRGNQRKRVAMTDDEVVAYLRDHTGDLVVSTLFADGSIHSVAMWFGFVGDKIGMLTKRKSQKVQNLRRDPRMTCLAASGLGYNDLRGVELIGTAEVTDDPTTMREIGLSVLARRTAEPIVQIDEQALAATLYNRVAVVHTALRIASWDHRKLLTPRQPLSAALEPNVGELNR